MQAPVERPNFLTDDLADKIVRELLRSPNDIVSACERAFVGSEWEGQTGLAINIEQYYRESHWLRKLYLDLVREIDISEIPDKFSVAVEVLELARNATKTTSTADKDFALRAYRLYAELMSMIDKGGSGGANVYINNGDRVTKVMVVPAEQSLEDWQRTAELQQRSLSHKDTKVLELEANKA